MGIEKGQELGRFLYNLAEAASKKTDALRGAATRLGRSPKEILNQGVEKIVNRQKETFKKSSKDWVAKISSDKAIDKQAAIHELQDNPLAANNIRTVKPVLREAIKNAQARGELPGWLPTDANAVKNPRVAEFAARVALFSKDLQDDPYVLQREIGRLSASTEWNALTSDARTETIRVIKNGLAHVRQRVDALNLSDAEKVRFSQATLETIPSDAKGRNVRSFSAEGARVVEDVAFRTVGKTTETRAAEAVAAAPDGVVIPANKAGDSSQLKAFLGNMRVINGGDSLHPSELKTVRDNIGKALNRVNREGKTIWTVEEAARLRQFRERINEYENTLAAKGERFNTIYVSQEETQEFLDNPYLFFEKRSREVESLIFRFGYDSDLLQHKMRRNELLSQWFSHDDFDDKLTAGQILGAEGIKRVLFEANSEQQQQLTEMRQKMFNIKTDVLDGIHNRARIHEFYFALNAAADPFKDPRVQGAILALSDRGILGAMKHYGALADYVATQKLPALHKSALHHLSSTINRRSTAEVTSAVRAQAVKQLKAEAPRHQATYAKHLETEMMKLKGVVSDQKLAHMLGGIEEMTTFDDQLCESIVNLGWVIYSLDFRQNGTMNQFALEPNIAERLGDISSYRGSSWEDSFAQLWRPVSMHLRKYGDLTDANRVSLHGRARMYVYKDDRLYDACVEETDKLWNVIEKHRKSWEHIKDDYFDKAKHHMLINRDDPFRGTESDPALAAKVQEYIDLVKFRGVFAEYHNGLVLKGQDPEFAHFLTTIHKFRTSLPIVQDSRDTLFNYVSIHAGIQLYERDAINPYGVWDSGAFRGLIERSMKLSGHWGKYFEPNYVCRTGLELGYGTHGETIGLREKEHGFMVGSRILSVAGPHFNPKEHYYALDAKDNGDKFLKALGVGAKTHPHELFRLQTIVEERPMDHVQAENFEKCVQVFGAIQHSLKTRGELPINYAADEASWTNVQKQVAGEVFTSVSDSVGLTKDKYLASMKSYFNKVIGVEKEPLIAFAHPKYARMFSTILWTDDVPLAELENTGILQAFGNEANSMATKKEELAKDTKFSAQVSHVGKARQSIFGITWLDHVTIGQNQLGTFINSLSPDPKIASEAMIDSDRFFFMYNSETDAGVSLAANMSGFAEAAKNRFWRIFKNFSFSSYLRKTAGPSESPSFDVDDAETFIDRIQAVRGAVHLRVPACGEAMEEVAGISNWRSWLTGRIRLQEEWILPQFVRDFLHNYQKSYTARFLPARFQGKGFNKVVEWLNLRIPSNILSYRVQNGLIYGALAIGLFGFASATGENEGEGHGSGGGH